MERQLRLLDHLPADLWRLDEHTRDLGRQGVADARRVLEQARRGDTAPPPHPTATAA